MAEDSGSSDDSLPISTKKRPRIVSTTSDSSDDDDLPIRRPRTNMHNVSSILTDLSEDEDSTTPKRFGNSSSGSESSDDEAKTGLQNSSKVSNSTTQKSHTSGNQTDSSEGNSDKCPICLLSFSNQNIGTPEICEHLFCADCITEWSKNVNTCPVDRLTFNKIIVRKKVGGKVIKSIPVSPRRPSEEEYFIEDTTCCEVCRLSNSEETMLLCDSCDLGYHMHCLTPPLTEIPETEWFCPRCARSIRNIEIEDDSEFIHTIDLENSELSVDLMSRIINATTRTLNRIHRVTRGSDPAPSTSGSTSSRRSRLNRTEQTSRRNRTSNNTIRRRRRQRRVRTRTVVVEYETRENEKFPIKVIKKRVKRHRKKKKMSKRAPRTAARRALVRSSVRGRLAEQKQRFSSNSEVTSAISSLAVPRLSLFGNANQLEYFEDSDFEESIDLGSGVGGMAVAVTSRSIASAILDSQRQVRRKMVSIPSPTYASTAPDILSSIMESQTLLYSKKSFTSLPPIKSNTKSQTSSQIINNKQVDIRNEDANENVKKAPGYPGAGAARGNGSWRGGQNSYQAQDNRGNYSNMSNDYQSNRGQDNSYQGNNRSFNSPWQSGNVGGLDNFQRRDQYDYIDRSPVQRNSPSVGRGRGGQLRFNQPPPQRNSQSISPWQNRNELPRPFSGPPTSSYPSMSMDMASNPVDMSTSQDNINYNMNMHEQNYQELNVYQTPQTIPPAISHTTPLPPPPQPPIIRFQRPPLSEDEGSDNSQPDEPDKYDPMEPTVDDSGSEDDPAPRPINIIHNMITIVSPPRKDHSLVAEYGSGSESPREAIATNAVQFNNDQMFQPKEPDFDVCPNFSIYSSTIDIMKNKHIESQNDVNESVLEKEEDLIQQDDQCEENNASEAVDDINAIPFPPGNNKSNENNDDELDDDWGVTSEQPNSENDTSVNNEEEDKDAHQPTSEVKEFTEDNSIDRISGCSLESLDKIEESVKNYEKLEDDAEPSPTKLDIERKSEVQHTVSKTPQKRTPITIKLLPNRGISKNVLNLYEKEDLVSVDTSGLDDKITCEISSKKKLDDGNSSVDDELRKIHETSDFTNNIEKMTECISDVEDERSYTPCLDEKIKDSTLESEKDILGIEGLDTEMISEDEGNDIFSDNNNQKTDSDGGALELPTRDIELHPGEFEEGEIVEKHKQKVKERVKALLKQPNKENASDDDRKKKKRDKKGDKDGGNKEKLRSKGKKGNDDTGGFKKLSKSNKERNYRDRDDKSRNRNNKDKRVSRSPDVNKENKKDNKLKEKKREKKKDIEIYDVRTIISEKGRRVKDAFGRDTSRPRSRSRESRVGSPRFRRSLSRRRSSSVARRSFSRGRRSVSRVHRTPIRGRRSLSRRRRSISRGRRSVSRRRKSNSRPRSVIRAGKSISSHRSLSPRIRRSISPRVRKVRSPRRRSVSRDRSPIRRRSITPHIRRSKSPKGRRSISRGKNKRLKISPPRGKRMSPRIHRESPPRRRLGRRSRSRQRSISKPRSISPKARKPRKNKRIENNIAKRRKSKSPPKLNKKRRSRSFSPGVVLSRSPSPHRPNVQEPWTRDKSPLYREWSSASQSMSPVRGSPGWTPPPQRRKSPQPDNLRVILTTKDKSKKKERKKKTNKRTKANERLLQQQKDTGPCKEVFTSGNNILVSVSFNKNQENQDVVEMPPTNVGLKKKKHKTDSTLKSKKDKTKEKAKKRRADKNKKSKDDDNKKPVAIIDLDKSPFKELTPSPKAVIILSDSENGEKEEELMERQEMIRGELLEMGFPQCDDVELLRRSPVRDSVYAPPAGPKTPPEPAIKFTIANKTNPQLRAVNPLHEDEEETQPEVTEEKQETDKRPSEVSHKGPNTPPDPPNSPPSSPDAYDPFEPTRSGSATPERPSSPQPEKRAEDLLQVPSMSLEAAQKSNLSADDVIQARPISPMEKVLALLKSTRNNLSPANTVQPLYPEQIFDNTRSTEAESQPATQPAPTIQSPEKLAVVPIATKPQVVSALVKPNSPKLIYTSVAPTVVTATTGFLNPILPRIPIYNTSTPPNPRILLPSPTKSSPLKMSTSKLFVGKPSPIKSTPIKPMPSKTIISKLPMPAIKPLPPRTNIKDKNKNGNDVIDLDLDMDSPYSPGSSDFGDLFDPPADNGKHSSNTYSSKPTNVFDSLFSAKAPSRIMPKSSHTKVTVKQTKKTNKGKVGIRMDDDTLRILDDVPSSAVELQVKTKYLKKLNRQERVVEEVKLVLKPHYSKKHISKEDYKEILRRAVPKICHNRSGEINPAKIHALIEAYVRKFRKKALMVK